MASDDFTIRRMTSDDVEVVLAAAELFDREPRGDWTAAFLARSGNHLFLAFVDGEPAGFVSGIEIGHPDKEVEMLLYELGVAEQFRRRGIGTALAAALRDHARRRGSRGMWVPIQQGDAPATATYRAAGARPAEPAAIMSWELDEPDS